MVVNPAGFSTTTTWSSQYRITGAAFPRNGETGNRRVGERPAVVRRFALSPFLRFFFFLTAC
jgi:hypothetical protein